MRLSLSGRFSTLRFSPAFLCAAGGRSDRRRRPKPESQLLLKIEHAFFKRVNVPHHQNRDKAEHAPKDAAALGNSLFVNHRPRIHEHDLQIEEDEEHGHEVELNAEPRLARALRHHPAFIWTVLKGGAPAGLPDQNTYQQSRGSE